MTLRCEWPAVLPGCTAAAGELYDQIRLKGRLDAAAARFYAAEIVLMLEALRAEGVVHRCVVAGCVPGPTVSVLGWGLFVNGFQAPRGMAGTPKGEQARQLMPAGCPACLAGT